MYLTVLGPVPRTNDAGNANAGRVTPLSTQNRFQATRRFCHRDTGASRSVIVHSRYTMPFEAPLRVDSLRASLAAVLLLVVAPCLHAATISIGASRDNTIIKSNPDNSLGAGPGMFVGTDGSGAAGVH